MQARVLGRLDRFSDAAPADDTDAQRASADALVTLAVCNEYGGRAEQARRQLDEATALARRAGHLGVELRAYLAVGISLLDEGRLRAAGDQLAAGARRAEATGTTWSGYGLDLRVALVVARFVQGDWDAAVAAAELAGESVSATVAARLAAVGMLAAGGRGRFDAVDRRLAELRATDTADDQVIMFAGQSGAEAALWRGRPGAALDRVREALAGLTPGASAPHLGSIMLAALGVAAQADLVVAGELPVADAIAAGQGLVEVAERAAAHGLPRSGTLGPEGRAWLCRARAELTRIGGADPDAWSAVFDAFGFETEEPPRAATDREPAGPEPPAEPTRAQRPDSRGAGTAHPPNHCRPVRGPRTKNFFFFFFFFYGHGHRGWTTGQLQQSDTGRPTPCCAEPRRDWPRADPAGRSRTT